MQSQITSLLKKPHIVVATLGRLVHILTEVGIEAIFRNMLFLVLDEADRILDPIFSKHIKTLLKYIPITKSGYQTLLFSVSMTRSIEDIKNTSLSNAFLFQSYEPCKPSIKSCLREQYI